MKPYATKKEQEYLRMIGKHAAMIKLYSKKADVHLQQLMGLIDALRTHTKNRIAAHKAHLTMAKKKIKRLPAQQGGFSLNSKIIGKPSAKLGK